MPQIWVCFFNSRREIQDPFYLTVTSRFHNNATIVAAVFFLHARYRSCAFVWEENSIWGSCCNEVVDYMLNIEALKVLSLSWTLERLIESLVGVYLNRDKVSKSNSFYSMQGNGLSGVCLSSVWQFLQLRMWLWVLNE